MGLSGKPVVWSEVGRASLCSRKLELQENEAHSCTHVSKKGTIVFRKIKSLKKYIEEEKANFCSLKFGTSREWSSHVRQTRERCEKAPACFVKWNPWKVLDHQLIRFPNPLWKELGNSMMWNLFITIRCFTPPPPNWHSCALCSCVTTILSFLRPLLWSTCAKQLIRTTNCKNEITNLSEVSALSYCGVGDVFFYKLVLSQTKPVARSTFGEIARKPLIVGPDRVWRLPLLPGLVWAMSFLPS